MEQPRSAEVAAAYACCARLAARHYENFTVVSAFVPRGLRPHFAAIYAYCRGVDDLGDEWAGDRVRALAAWEAEVDRCYDGRPERPEFLALQHTIRRFGLPPEPFRALIEANRMDQVHTGFAAYKDLRRYCACSAEPVGRLVLMLWGIRDSTRLALSDATCTALQLANFWQDVGRDLARGRVYLPRADMARFGYSLHDLGNGVADDRWRALLAFEVRRTRRLFRQGARLEAVVPARLRLQLRLYRMGGEAVLDALQRQGYDPFRRRPQVGRAAKAILALRALWQPRTNRGTMRLPTSARRSGTAPTAQRRDGTADDAR